MCHQLEYSILSINSENLDKSLWTREKIKTSMILKTSGGTAIKTWMTLSWEQLHGSRILPERILCNVNLPC